MSFTILGGLTFVLSAPVIECAGGLVCALFPKRVVVVSSIVWIDEGYALTPQLSFEH